MKRWLIDILSIIIPVAAAIILCGMAPAVPSASQRQATPEAKRIMSENLKKDYYIKKVTEDSPDLNKKLAYLDTLKQRKMISPGELLKTTTSIYITSGHYYDALKELETVYERAPLSLDTTLYTLFNLAYCNLVIGNYDSALDNIYKITIIDKPDSMLNYQIDSDMLLARIYRVAQHFEKSDSILSKCYSSIPPLKIDSSEKSRLQFLWHLERSSAYLEEQNFDAALEQLNLASEYDVDESTMLLVTMGLAQLYHSLGQAEIAEEYYMKSFTDNAPLINKLCAYNNYCIFLREQKRYDEAKRIILEQIEYVEDNGINYVKGYMYETLSDILYEQGDYAGALNAYRKYFLTVRDMMWRGTPALAKNYEEKIRLYQIQKESQNNRGKHEGNTAVTILLLIAAVLAFVILVYGIRRGNVDKDSPVEGNEKKDDVSEDKGNEDALGGEELKRELLAMSLKMAQNDRILETVWDITSSDKISEVERVKELNSLRRQSGASNDTWEMFHYYFEKVNPDFIKALREAHPELSRGELRMCAFIIMGLSTKDIATISHRSVRTVESMKYRLNKKLNFESGQTTESYLHSLLPATDRHIKSAVS